MRSYTTTGLARSSVVRLGEFKPRLIFGSMIKPVFSFTAALRLKPPCLTNVRNASSKSTTMRGRVITTMIADKYIPPSSLPAPINKANWNIIWERIKKLVLATWSVYQVKTTTKGWKPRAFAIEAEKLYIAMNKAYARGDRAELSNCVTDGMMSALSPEIKAMQRIGKFVWDSNGSDRRPQVVHLATAKVATETGDMRLSQITVRVNVRQSMATYKDDTLIAGNPDTYTSIVEHIVMEKWLDGKWANRPWKIAGKIQPSSNSGSK
ncbi:hypothetical protein BATDEDRAFT_91206 [Batrachochytrium dendrobatidis JAM81]|uniref:Large ribosomal subunit protein mL45 n=1 Tax=Batrachochytrium dendrobatidis (strain JAM81 / FGSC 10211) TaxID=684364 RepID=F4P9V5_BATDJ|nr:uncharacterized protein BATDEDRAFT_91206 [Batrachochytrium dendrobatidis JAM81]EGF78008.1 hypothetical protein BATDEDRAFT_91206 [Batrachochytrium dendrobatidis JAM81]KAJ8330139.1 hypothetical protein O5D80_001711 [Batrachochytrium dendrobatidis]KAK5670442.1 hypothetical protein QVD99_003126 [Batrachochytrium dendrobatidis]|eukprot:XP_006681546.1 hypothetical protein BATDEDRAFT_91206 [Batrachochytrium dendrobatidis JAM81]